MRRIRTTDGGSRYVVTIPFAREVPKDEREAIHEALASAAFYRRHRYDETPIDTREIDVTADRARVTVGLPYDADHDPTDVRGRLNAAIGEWHTHHGPLGEPTRAGGDATLASLDADALALDRDLEDAAAEADDDADVPGVHTYLLAEADRPMTDEEVAALEHVTDDGAVVTEHGIALFDAVDPITPPRVVLGDLRTSLPARVPQDHDLRTRGFFGTREVGTLAAIDEPGRGALIERLLPATPTDEATDTDSETTEA
jgi:hypothetical protein